MGYVKEVFGSRELLANLTLREIRGKYKRTVLGQLWSLFNPLALMLIYTLVFAFILRVQPSPGDPSGLNFFALWLLCGLLPWMFLANVMTHGVRSLVENANLIQKVYFTRIVLPLSLVGSVGYNWLIEMGVLIAAIAIVGGLVLPWLPLLLVAMALLAIFAAGITLALSVANVYFRDTEYFLTLGQQIWMYLTPIIYPAFLVEQESVKVGGLFGTPITIADLFHLNPMEHFVNVFRQLLYDNRWPDPSEWLWCAGAAAVSISIGLIIFRRHEKRLAELL
jgi:lipopolysaccharide transport system permease protein